MARIYDLSVTLRPEHMEERPLTLSATPHDEAARVFAKQHGVRVSALPRGAFFASERVGLGSHLGTHIDAPYHFYPTSEGRPAKFIDEVPLEWCFADAVVLDFRHKRPTEHITEYDIAEALEKIHYTPKPNDIVMLWTGGTERYDDDPKFHVAAAGLNGGALNYVFHFGVKIMSSDSATIDMPIPLMTERLLQGDKAAYFPIHRAGQLKEWTHAEKIAHLDTLPGPFGFKVMFFPIKLRRATGAWIRAVAIEDEWLAARPLQLVDLSQPIMPASFEPEESRIITTHHDMSARARAKRLGMRVGEAPHLGAMDHVETYSHAGTHVDAPYHFGPGAGGQRALTAERLPLEWFYADAVLLDFSADKRPGDVITTADVRGALDRLAYRLKAGDIVLLRSGADAHFEDDPAFVDQGVALEREALMWLLDQGVRVVGTDAESLDGPLTPMVEALRAGNADAFYPVQYAGREREFCAIPKMDLRGLPRPHGFKVVAFPIKLEGASAAWTRAVALVP
ncbi:MAG TPA: cyclase family protein [Chloroflexota bacterium]|jgi:kynurenine formamidase